MTKLLRSLLAILVIGVVVAAVIEGGGIDPESSEAWRIWSFAAIVAAFVSSLLMCKGRPASP